MFSMRKPSRSLGFALLASLLLSLLAACGSSSTSKPAAGTQTPAAPAQPVELKMWTFLDPAANDLRGNALKSIVEEFNAANPKIKVTVESIHFSKIDAQAIQAAATGAGPDILNVYSVQLPQHVSAGSIQPITKYAQEWLKNEGKDYIFPIDTVTFDGQIMALPWEMRVWLLMYRKDLLEKAGLPVPKTLAELGEVGGKLRKASGDKVTGLAIGMSEGGLGADFMEKFEPLLWAGGGALLGKDGKAAFADANGVKAMEWMVDLVNKHGAMGRETLKMTADDVLNGLKAGTIAMAIEGSHRLSAARSGEGIGTNLAATPVPGFTADKPTPALAAGQTLTIGKNTKHADAAWTFIKFYLAKESQLKFAKASVMPVIEAAYNDPQIASGPQAPEFTLWRNYVKNHGKLGRYPDNFPQMSDILVKAGQKILFENAPAAATLQKAATDYNALTK